MDREHIYAYTKNGLIFHYSDVDFTNKNIQYFFDENLEHELVNVAGHVNTHHWRLKIDRDLRTEKYKDFSPKDFLTHKNAEKYFIKNKILKYLDATIKAHKVVAEHDAKKAIKSEKYIPDIVFLDKNNNPVCIVEIFITNKKSKEHVEYYNTLDIPCFEIAYEKGCQDFENYLEIKLLNHGITNEKGITKPFEQALHEAKTKERMVKRNFAQESAGIERQKRSINRNLEILQREVEEFKKRDGSGIREKYNERIKTAKSRIAEIRYYKDRIKRVKERIRELKDTITTRAKLKENSRNEDEKRQIPYLERQIRKIRKRIQWQENRSKQANTIIKRNF